MPPIAFELIPQDQGGRRKKLIAVAEWEDEYLHQCDGCRDTDINRQPPQDPPCDACREPVLNDNRDAMMIFNLVKNQFLMGPGGPVEIDHQAIHSAMNLYHIRNKKECFEKVLSLCAWRVGEIVRRTVHEG